MYKINDKVTFLDETGIYTLIELLPNNEIKVEDEHGFDRICREKDIVLFESSTFDGIEIETFENRDVRVNPFAKKRKREKNIPMSSKPMRREAHRTRIAQARTRS